MSQVWQQLAGSHFQSLDPAHPRESLDRYLEDLSTGDQARPRLTTMNLLLGIPHPEDASDLAPLLERLAQTHPGRHLVFVLDPDASQESLDGAVAHVCSAHHPERVCSERVVLYCPGSPARLPSLVLPMTIPGLPVYLWWRGEPPFDSDLLERFVEGSDRVIFDSSRFSLSGAMARLDRLLRDPYHTEQAFSDLSWGRSLPVRERVAALFDGPGGAQALARIQEVTITGPADRPDPSSLLLAGWLASRLGWEVSKPIRAEGKVWVGDLSCQTGPIRLRLASGRAGGWGIGLTGQPEVSCSALSGCDLMGREFDIQVRDPVFEQSLHKALILSGERQPLSRD